jgi:histidyl-tRNA synthetase
MNTPPGVFDILPSDPKEPWRSSHLWNFVENIARQTAKQYGFQEIRTPIFERTELFCRSVGETSDIVSKEMYTFIDKGGRSMSLRPEGTAPVMRSFIENSFEQHKLFYLGPMFRYERAQAGRYRQHHQFGAEVIGVKGPEQDAEVIDLLYTLYQRLGLSRLHVQLNSIGDMESRLNYRTALQDFLRSSFSQLSEDSQIRFEKNPLRILDSKDPKDKELIQNAPSILDYLSSESKDHFEEVKRYLTLLKIPFEVNDRLVRGLDYYNNTVFEVVASELGAQNTIGAGGRYDGLIKTLGGPDLHAIGFGTGLERVIQTMIKQNVPLPQLARPMIYFIPLGDEEKKVCFTLMHQLRMQGISVQMEMSGRKLSKAVQRASQLQAEFIAVVGENELKSKEVELKEMSSGTKVKAPLFNLARILLLESRKEQFVTLWNEIITPFEQEGEADFCVNRLLQSIASTSQLSQRLQEAILAMDKILKE